MSLAHRAPLRAVLAALVAACLSALTVAPAHAAAYRYWGFYQLTDGAWAFAQKGSDQTVPKDGSVDGWRFAVADEASTPLPARRPDLRADLWHPPRPRPARSGSASSSTTAAQRTPPTAPPRPSPKALCAVVAPDATSTDVLAAAGEVRVENGLVCGVAGYPTADCGGEVKELSPEAKAADTAGDHRGADRHPVRHAASTPGRRGHRRRRGASVRHVERRA